MASSGGGWGTFFKQELGRGGYNFYLKIFLGGFSFETLHCFENHRPPPPPRDVINDRSLIEFMFLDINIFWALIMSELILTLA